MSRTLHPRALVSAFAFSLTSACAASPASPPPRPAAPRIAIAEAKRPSPPQASSALPLPVVDPSSAGIDAAALAELERRGEETHSDGIVVLKDGKLVASWTFGTADGPIEAMSVTKSIVALAIGHLVDAGKIRSLDEPVATFFPEWKQGKKQTITLRHLLTQTSGLQADRTTEEIYRSPDFVKLALAAELTTDPGAAFFYNNKAVNLLAGVVQIASGERMDRYIQREIFAPLGIENTTWTLDRAGNPHAMSGLQIRPVDLARIGEMMRLGGASNGRRLLSEAWVGEATAAGSPRSPKYGLLWWLDTDGRSTLDDGIFAAWKTGGMEPAFLAKLQPLRGRIFESRKEFFGAIASTLGGEAGLESWYDHTWRRGLPDGKLLEQHVVAFRADGYLGQHLVVIPSRGIVGVRMRRAHLDEKNDPGESFDDFTKKLWALSG